LSAKSRIIIATYTIGRGAKVI